MKFKGNPGTVIVDRKSHKAIGKFDKNGIFETNIPEYIGRLKLCHPEVKQHACKKCDAVFETKGELLQHYKKEHPKK